MEFNAPRQKIQMVYEGLNNRVDPKEASKIAYRCLACKRCSSVCPYGIDVSQLLWLNRHHFKGSFRKHLFIMAYMLSKLFRRGHGS